MEFLLNSRSDISCLTEFNPTNVQKISKKFFAQVMSRENQIREHLLRRINASRGLLIYCVICNESGHYIE